MSLREGCKEILKADCVDLATRLNAGQRKGVKVEEETKCSVCSGYVTSLNPTSGAIVFFCKHVYHQHCLRTTAQSGTEQTGKKIQESEKKSNQILFYL